MSTFTSTIQQRGIVPFPAFTGERVYMREFQRKTGMPRDLRRWQPAVDAMLEGIDVDGPIYLMIDQGVVTRAACTPVVHLRAHLPMTGTLGVRVGATDSSLVSSPNGRSSGCLVEVRLLRNRFRFTERTVVGSMRRWPQSSSPSHSSARSSRTRRSS